MDKIRLSDKQIKCLKAAGFEGFIDILYLNTDDVLDYVFNIVVSLESHNKNYTKDQYHKISALDDLVSALYRGRENDNV